MKEWTNRVSSKIQRKYKWFDPEKTLLEHLQLHENILEIGSGMGRYIKLIPKVVGLEFSRHFIKYCSEANIDGIFLRADGFNIPIRDNTFDLVFSSRVIEHFDNPIDIIKEHKRVCREGGKVIITVPAKDSPDYQLHKIWQKCLAKSEKKDWHYYGKRVSDKELQNLLKMAGLDNIELFHLGVPLRGDLVNLLKFLKLFLYKPSINAVKGIILEGLGILIHICFRFSLSVFIFKNYIKRRGYYLFSMGKKMSGLHKQNVDIKIKSYNELYKLIICPKCHKTLYKNNHFLFCTSCSIKFPTINNIPYLTVNDAMEE